MPITHWPTGASSSASDSASPFSDLQFWTCSVKQTQRSVRSHGCFSPSNSACWSAAQSEAFSRGRKEAHADFYRNSSWTCCLKWMYLLLLSPRLFSALAALFVSALIISVIFAIIPLCTNVLLLAIAMAVSGLAMGIIDTIANIQLVTIYQRDSAVFLQVKESLTVYMAAPLKQYWLS